MKKQTKFVSFLICIYTFTLVSLLNIANATGEHPIKIRMAIIDNFTAEQFPQMYINSYFSGIITAVSRANRSGFNIEYKTFTYGNRPLAILEILPEVRNWKPDFIIGPHSSNQFLILKKSFKNILVLSPYATDESIDKMPPNFHSLSLPDRYMAKATTAFMDKYFPDKDIFNIAQGDCKDCIDMTLIFSKMYLQKYPNVTLTNSFYIGNDIKNLNIKKLMSNYKSGSVIILQPLSYADAKSIMLMISTFLKINNLVFVYNLDNWGNSEEPENSKEYSKNNYISFRVSPLFLDQNSLIYSNFIADYLNKFHKKPKNAVTYMSYATVMSVVDALSKYTKKYNKDIRYSVLKSYLAALKNDSNWYRSKLYMASKLESKGEIDLGMIATFQ